jgi:hypothetical protein
MRARVSAASLRKLDKVESLLFDDHGQSRGGVLLVPPIEYDLDAWERAAMGAQQRLVRETQEALDSENVAPVVEEQRDPSDVTRFYKANPLLEQSRKAHLLR